jgi:hypothetical protein
VAPRRKGASRQADAAAATIAMVAGAPAEAEPFRPVLRGRLMTGGDDRYLRHGVAGGDGGPEVASRALWWPPSKIAGRYLAPYLSGLDDIEAVEQIGRATAASRRSSSGATAAARSGSRRCAWPPCAGPTPPTTSLSQRASPASMGLACGSRSAPISATNQGAALTWP